MGQLPPKCITPDMVFKHVGLDIPAILKSYVCIFISMSVKAVHLELVSDLSTESFIACLTRFVARRRKPSSIWSDHSTNFLGANRVLKEHSYSQRKQRKQSVTSALLKELTGTSFQNEHPILGVYGKRP